ncbi:APC family permease [Streptomyces albus subsp. chlorinus]|uniref:APC family permease n=1 Tax=Streptomyces albus TaxID=1888 RepID=UPI00156F8D0C|nr:APC family permease [Streptomyces albus]NSC23665.1 APC family permease [Streptomyces albus subsp. chlorinus]
MAGARTRTSGILGDLPGGALRRSLTLRDLIVYGLLFIAPMAPVGIYGALDARSHGVVPLVYVVATVAMSFTAYSYARMIHTVPQAGSVYAYARAGLGNGAGFVTGWMMMLDYLLIPAVAYLFSGIAMAQLVPEVDQWVWTALAVVVTTALNLSGVRRAAAVGLLVLAMEILVLLVFVVAALVVLAQHGPERDWLSPLTGDRAFSLTALLSAVSVAVLSFLGFDAIANFAEEAVGGKGRGAPMVARAVVWCLFITGFLFVLQTYLAALLSQDSSRQLAAHPAAQGSAFYDATKAAVGGWLETTVAASKALGAAFAALAGQAAASRLLYAMARDRRLPHVLGGVSSRTGVPGRALLLSAVLTMCAAVWAARAPDGLDRLVSIVDIGALFAFGMLHLSVVGYHGLRRRPAGAGGAPPGAGREAGAGQEAGDGGRRAGVVGNWVLPLAGFAIIVAVIVTANREAHWVGLGWLVLALLALLVLRRRDAGRTGTD